MSWQGLFDQTQLSTSDKIAKAAILGQAGGVWARSSGYEHSHADEIAIVNAFKNLDKLRGEGMQLRGVKFFTMTADDQQIHLRKRGGADGVLIVKTKQAVLVAEYVAPVQAPEAMSVVGGVADYLVGLNY